MKKFFLALSVLAMLIFAAVPSHALLSMPDAVPGQDILLPFFLSAITSGESTLLVVQEVHGNATTLAVDVYDIDSTSRHDTTETMSGYDVEAWNVRDDWIASASPTDREALKIDLDGDGVNDHYAGYVKLVNASADANDLVAFIYQIDLSNGIASGLLAVSEEYENTAVALADGMVDATFIELFNADALAAAQMRLVQLAPTTPLAFAKYPRYFVYNSDGTNYIFSWRSDGTNVTAHFDFYNEIEKAYSGNITITHELDIIDVMDIIPSGHTGSYPIGGWIKWKYPGKKGAGFNATREWLMYSYQQVAAASAGANWNIIFEAHTEAFTTSAAY